MSNVIAIRDRQRSANIDLLQLIDGEVRSTTTLICAFEQLRQLTADFEAIAELLLHHHERLQSIQKLALSLHERAIASPQL